jgi:hypothetical protein
MLGNCKLIHVKHARFISKGVVWTTVNLGLEIGDRSSFHFRDPDRMAVVFD